MLSLENLHKRFGARVIFEGLTHRLGAGCVALRGPNGIGKSTLLATIAGIELPDRGDVWIAGHSLRREPLAARRALAFIPDALNAYPFMTGRALFALVASARRARFDERIDTLIERLRVAPYLDVRFDELSLGTGKKLSLIAAALGEPPVVIADEPGNGLDAAAMSVLAGFLREIGRDRLALFSTHDDALIEATGARVLDWFSLVSPGHNVSPHAVTGDRFNSRSIR
jgi:heme-transporting ATPase